MIFFLRHAHALSQDIVPATGLTMFKPSQIWPPPPSDVGSGIHGVINPKPLSEAKAPAITADQPDIRPRFELEPATSAASGEIDQTIRMKGDGGNPFEITRQIQLYTTNALLKHPLVSPVFAYLGGLPPLFVIASDREVLRDEIIYTLVYLTASVLKGGHSLSNKLLPAPIALRIQPSILCGRR
jgi:acetyl esterase/lipase